MYVDPHLCIACRGAKYLCGLGYCPILVKNLSMKVKVGKIVNGDSPPSVFVGRFGYPRITVYPSTPPEFGDTSIYEDPRAWLTMDINRFLAMRMSVVRGGIQFKVSEARSPGRELYDVQVASLSPRPVEMELNLEVVPRGRVLSETVPPLGPSAPLKRLNLGTLPPPEKVVEKVFQERDMKAGKAIERLYSDGIPVERIARLLSVGNLGVERKLVPTRWSITAVDKTLSDLLVRKIKEYPSIDQVEVYVRKFRLNTFVAILVPGEWAFEWGEAWFPSTTWNMWGSSPQVEVDYEEYLGRKTYPDIGGCYYSSRLAVAEHLERRRRQAIPILWREIYPGFYFPVGVWFVRENIRELLKSESMKFDTVNDALKFLEGVLKVSPHEWSKHSGLIPMIRSRLFP
ncbi:MULTISPECIES: Nre family DNA repair protein [Metallosphaera]|uniref:Nre family DNA repair protein n=1 Tax=Metallosphaera TaxID=41980 RepID=UPI0018773885|nr:MULTISPECIES: Nre family DNA repair protein [Metallosphaera]MCH1771910.1 Nre family DNA repair protein [Metallosphaera sedula]MCP6728568.1 Nre family DNA repair protein [Metallosphaera sedula]